MSQTKAHLQIVQPLSSRMTEAHIRRHASRAALEYVDGVVAVVWADGTREEFSRTSSGGVPLAGEAAVLTDACLPADVVYGPEATQAEIDRARGGAQ